MKSWGWILSIKCDKVRVLKIEFSLNRREKMYIVNRIERNGNEKYERWWENKVEIIIMMTSEEEWVQKWKEFEETFCLEFYMGLRTICTNFSNWFLLLPFFFGRTFKKSIKLFDPYSKPFQFSFRMCFALRFFGSFFPYVT